MDNIMNSKRYSEARAKAEKLLATMSLTEKIGQLSQFGTSIYSDERKYMKIILQRGK